MKLRLRVSLTGLRRSVAGSQAPAAILEQSPSATRRPGGPASPDVAQVRWAARMWRRRNAVLSRRFPAWVLRSQDGPSPGLTPVARRSNLNASFPRER